MNKNEAIEMTMKGFNWTLFTKKKIYWNYQNGRKASKFVCVHITKEHNNKTQCAGDHVCSHPCPKTVTDLGSTISTHWAQRG